jgi:aldehyde dehydrogenase (NAD+)
MYRHEFFIGGQWVAPLGTEIQPVISPSTEEVVGEVPLAIPADMDAAVAAAKTAFENGSWADLPPVERADILARAAELIRKRESDIARVTIDEMGVAASSATGSQTGLVANVFDYYAELIRTYAFERSVVSGDRASLVTSVPVGVVAAIVPWNAPVTLAAWKVGPALASGCTVVLKPPPEAPLSNYLLVEALEEAGVPAGVINLVPGGREVGEHLVLHPDVAKIAFTGSTAAGKQIMSLCGQQVKRVSLELGGKSAAIILDDADVATVVPRVVGGGMHLSGQVCGLHSRVLVPRSRYEEVVQLAGSIAEKITVGDPHDPKTVVGPLVAERQRDRVEGYIKLAVEEGGRLIVGGERPAHLPKGWYVGPTILADIDNSMRIAQEEIFGPVLVFIPYDDDDDAVRIANDSDFGLSGGVWSADPERALNIARQMRTGSVSVNGMYPQFPLVPFGGFKQSGLGRELGAEGLQSFLETRSIGIPVELAATS